MVKQNCIEVEVHPDYIEKDGNGIRLAEGKINPNTLMHVYRGVVNIEGQPFRIKFLFKEQKYGENPLYAYVLDEIEIENTNSFGVTSEDDIITNGLMYAPNELVSATNVLNGVEKSYDSGVKLLDASAINTESKQGERFSIADKQSQLDIINNSNPMQDDVHTGIRSGFVCLKMNIR